MTGTFLIERTGVDAAKQVDADTFQQRLADELSSAQQFLYPRAVATCVTIAAEQALLAGDEIKRAIVEPERGGVALDKLEVQPA